MIVVVDGGVVVSIDPQGRLPPRFVNSRSPHDLEARDSAAFASHDNWWALILEQVDSGLL